MTQLDTHAPVVCIFDIAAASLPSLDSESGATQERAAVVANRPTL